VHSCLCAIVAASTTLTCAAGNVLRLMALMVCLQSHWSQLHEANMQTVSVMRNQQ
jgi:hypothetical protein